MTGIIVTEHTCRQADHTTFYLAAGPEDGPLVIFTHGWPELSISWRHQLPFFAAMGFRAIAPDMRGYGRSSVHPRHEDYRQEAIVADMLALIDSLGREQAIWIGHDWGAPVAWNMAAHHPDRCRGVVGLCVPYASIDRGLDFVTTLVDRTIYPADRFPFGQWEYMRYYEESFDAATAAMDKNPRNMINLVFRKGSSAGQGQPAGTAMVRLGGGWFGGADSAPPAPRDDDVVGERDASIYAAGLERNGFFGPNAWYMNHAANADYFARLPAGGALSLPALFLHARFDYTCETLTSKLAEPMRALCTNLTEEVVDSGHWMAQEKPWDLNRCIVRWLVQQKLV